MRRHLQEMKNNGVALHMIDLGGDTTGNGVSKLVFTILSAVAEAERDRTRERITEVKRDQRTWPVSGRRPPFGYRKGEAGELVPVAEQQAAKSRKMKRLPREQSLRAIAAALRADGVVISHVGVRGGFCWRLCH